MKKESNRIVDFIQRYIMRNIPAVMVVIFIVWHLFWGNDCYLNICKNDQKIRDLQEEIETEEALIEQLHKDISSSESDAATIERIARERHNMQQAHEDVYLIVTDNDTTQNTTTDITQ